MCLGDPNCKCNMISDIRALRDQEILFGKRALRVVDDDEKVANARMKYAQNPTFDNLMELGSALAFQMRYHEAIECFEGAIELNPDSYQARRKCAGRYLSTLQLDKAEEAFEWCDERGEDRLDTRYMLGCIAYYKYEYEKALALFEECFALAKDNDDMYVAALFWAIACSVQLGRDLDGVYARYKDMQIGHHTGYLQAVRLFMGEDLKDCDNIPKEDKLQNCIFMYGVHLYYLHRKNAMLADIALKNTLANDTYFSAFAYLGAYTEYLKNNN